MSNTSDEGAQPGYAETFEIFAEHFLKEKLVRKCRTMKAELRDNLLIESEDIDYVRKKKDGSVGFYKGRKLVHEVAAGDIDIDIEKEE